MPRLDRFFVFLPLIFVACSYPKESMVEHKRDAGFFDQFVNSSQDYKRAAERIGEIKLLQTGTEYPIRAALFDNGKFYYQVDRLGDGFGDWTYYNGAVELKAIRPYFDLDFIVSAAEASGNKTSIHFIDRFGVNHYPLELREPAKKETAKPLPEFSHSPKGI